MRYRLNEPAVAGELLDGELVLINFDSGSYYSLQGTAADICGLVSSGHDIDKAATALAEQHTVDQATVRGDVVKFVAQLVAEGLICESSQDQTPGDCSLVSKEYATPVIEKFDDMADQLLLDPIHEIDKGWPQKKSA